MVPLTHVVGFTGIIKGDLREYEVFAKWLKPTDRIKSYIGLYINR